LEDRRWTDERVREGLQSHEEYRMRKLILKRQEQSFPPGSSEKNVRSEIIDGIKYIVVDGKIVADAKIRFFPSTGRVLT
jgi:hypothetical protein